jgi:hypothetical protein
MVIRLLWNFNTRSLIYSVQPLTSNTKPVGPTFEVTLYVPKNQVRIMASDASSVVHRKQHLRSANTRGTLLGVRTPELNVEL